jgi:hypothetical protein
MLAAELRRSVTHVDANALPWRTGAMMEFGGGKADDRDTGLRRRADPERRRQDRIFA